MSCPAPPPLSPPRGIRTDVNARICVSIVHRDQLFARLLAAYLGDEPDIEVVAVHESLDSAMVVQSRPDILLLGFLAMVTGGLEVVRSIRAKLPDLKIVVLTTSLDEETVRWSIEFGAVGCVTWDRGPDELVDALHLVADGRVLVSPEVLMGLIGASDRREPVVDRSSYSLGPREIEVLEALADGLGTAAVAERLSVSPHTVRAHLKSALAKLNARSRTEAIALALRHRLIRTADRPS